MEKRGYLAMHEYVRIKNIKEGDILGRTVYDEKCRILLKSGNTVTNRSLVTLRELGYKGLYIENDTLERREDIPIAEPLLEELTILQLVGLLKELYENKNIELNVFDITFAATRKKIEELVEEMVKTFIELERSHKLIYEMEDTRNNKNWIYYHSLNTTIISIGIAIKLGLDKKRIYDIALGAIYHDLGKVLIEKGLIDKANLTPKEKEVLRQHPEKAFRVFQRLDYPLDTTYGIWLHHEHCDGSGYPKQVSDSQIPLAAKVIGLASYFDNIINFTPYNDNPMYQHEAIEMVSADSKFDNDCKRALLKFVSAYPVGSKVELSDGNQGLILKNHPDFILRPYVLVGRELYDLVSDEKCRNITITKIIDQ